MPQDFFEITDTFTCEKYRCFLTRRACAERRAARLIVGGFLKKPTYPGCQECDQGEKMAAGIRTDHIVPTYPGQKYKIKQEAVKMAYPGKIDNEKLKKMIAEGKYTDDIAKAFGVFETSIRVRAKRLGLTLNYRRKPAGVAAPPAAPSSVDLTYRRFAPPAGDRAPSVMPGAPGQIIPVTLQLTVDIRLRVSTEGVA